MPTEIERKYLVTGTEWRSHAVGKLYRQGYIPTHDLTTVRVRIAGSEGFLTIKGKTDGVSRAEFEYPIPIQDAEAMLETLCDRPLIEKTRYTLEVDGLIWEIDEFQGENEGLILAEVELSRPDQLVTLPSWAGPEVSADPRYYNSNLAKTPYTQWAIT